MLAPVAHQRFWQREANCRVTEATRADSRTKIARRLPWKKRLMCTKAKLRKTRLNFQAETTHILLNFDPFQSGKRPLSLVFNAESSYIFYVAFIL